jgi:hypothetical protein
MSCTTRTVSPRSQKPEARSRSQSIAFPGASDTHCDTIAHAGRAIWAVPLYRNKSKAVYTPQNSPSIQDAKDTPYPHMALPRLASRLILQDAGCRMQDAGCRMQDDAGMHRVGSEQRARRRPTCDPAPCTSCTVHPGYSFGLVFFGRCRACRGHCISSSILLLSTSVSVACMDPTHTYKYIQCSHPPSKIIIFSRRRHANGTIQTGEYC